MMPAMGFPLYTTHTMVVTYSKRFKPNSCSASVEAKEQRHGRISGGITGCQLGAATKNKSTGKWRLPRCSTPSLPTKPQHSAVSASSPTNICSIVLYHQHRQDSHKYPRKNQRGARQTDHFRTTTARQQRQTTKVESAARTGTGMGTAQTLVRAG